MAGSFGGGSFSSDAWKEWSKAFSEGRIGSDGQLMPPKDGYSNYDPLVPPDESMFNRPNQKRHNLWLDMVNELSNPDFTPGSRDAAVIALHKYIDPHIGKWGDAGPAKAYRDIVLGNVRRDESGEIVGPGIGGTGGGQPVSNFTRSLMNLMSTWEHGLGTGDVSYQIGEDGNLTKNISSISGLPPLIDTPPLDQVDQTKPITTAQALEWTLPGAEKYPGFRRWLEDMYSFYPPGHKYWSSNIPHSAPKSTGFGVSA